MRYRSTIQDTMQCNLEITASARKGIVKWSKDEYAFFSMQDAFYVYIEKRPENRLGNMSFSIFFDNVKNNVLSKNINDRVAVMECIYKNDGFLATGFQVRGRREQVQTNRRHPVRLKFNVGRSSGIAMPIELYTSLRELPIAQERSEYVEKRISSWEGYLRIQERNADVADLTASFTGASFNDDFSKLSLVCHGLNGKDWNVIRGFSAKMKGLNKEIGNVVNVNRSKSIVEIELTSNYSAMARRNEWQPKTYKEVVFSNFAELSQVRRLRKGFKDLQDGLAANSNLEKVLFEDRPTVRISKQTKELTFHNELNKFQKEAVTGAMTANDLYIIQGPPGTGKTTVISELCHQNVKAGLRTLVASQANLAVDNALSRLLSHQDIRILRYGRTDSIEEEGKKFIEENVALNWKIQTLTAVNQQLQSNSEREKQLKDDLTSCAQQLDELQKELVLLEEKIRLKNIAQAEHLKHTKELTKLKKSVGSIKEQREALLNSQASLNRSADELAEDINRIEHLLYSKNISSEAIEQMKKLEKQIAELCYYISYRQNAQRISETENTLAMVRKELELKGSKVDGLSDFMKELQAITKLDVLKSHLDDVGIVPMFATNQKMIELNRLISTIKLSASGDEYKEWKELNDRLVTAIRMLEDLLQKNGFLKQTGMRNPNQKHNSVKDIHAIIDRVGRFLIEPATKQILANRNYSAQKYDYLEKIASALELLRERRNYAQAQGVNFEKENQIKLDSKNMFASIRIEIVGDVNQSISIIEEEKSVVQSSVEAYQIELNDLHKTNKELQQKIESVDETSSISEIKEEVSMKEKLFTDYEEKRELLKQNTYELKNKKNDAEVIAKQLESNSVSLQRLKEELELLNLDVLGLEKQLVILAELLKQKPEEQREQNLTSYYAMSKKVEELEIEKERLPVSDELQKQWLSLLTEANEYDLDEIRKLYVRHANVIGTTCVASASRNFVEEYPTFDVVIIDEVSKATPPELLLPMLKGKKIILVGDHHQLPPLMGQETLEELLEESDNNEEKKELEKLLKESLFERLFRTLPDRNKTMLGIQYRMHESIMETITPFYKEGNYSLQCGLTDSDAMRDHLLDSPYIKRDDHLLWIDMPNEPKYFEEQVKGGTSRYNQSELAKVRNILMDLEAATKKAKSDGRMKLEDKKSVGIISFYGEQVKRVDRLIQQDLMPQHLNCRTGSVDKFQGMEMDIIIVSFVRNHRNKGGDIGFAKDYRRLNVALSRARELLIIVGSSDMFTLRTKLPSSREMYGRLLEVIKMKNGFRDNEGNCKL